ncbi:MAG: Asd/ArgC dimerization domain-containing protein [Polyangiaceae bacterium]
MSGYSGAGTTPSPKNDPELLRDNLMPYSLVGHVHEREVSRHLGKTVRFMPHVAPFFRGIMLTISTELSQPISSAAELMARYESRYRDKSLIRVQKDAPWVRDVMNRHEVVVGGFAVDPTGTHAVVVVTIDNLLKGAATQALQNLNLALGFDELAGIA